MGARILQAKASALWAARQCWQAAALPLLVFLINDPFSALGMLVSSRHMQLGKLFSRLTDLTASTTTTSLRTMGTGERVSQLMQVFDHAIVCYILPGSTHQPQPSAAQSMNNYYFLNILK